MAHEKDVFRELEHTIETRSLELAYENACRQVERVCDAERARQLQVHILCLEDENDALQSQVAQNNDCINGLEKRNGELQEDFRSASASLDSAQGDLRLKKREIETLNAELNSLHGVTMDSTKLLTEKLTLARELSSLRPEIDHLRSQAASHQTLLAEKLSLQRQLNTIQVELETEERSVQRILAKENETHAEKAKLESRVETLQSELAKERRERGRLEREGQKASTESESRRATLDARLDTFRTKLKTTKEQLKETQTALETARSVVNVASTRTKRPTNTTTSFARNSQKRAATEMDADTMIGTPGPLPVAKKSKRASSLVGEKSTFSITPFLNRTASMGPESPSAERASNDGETSMAPGTQKPETVKPSQVSDPVARNLDLTNRAARSREPGIMENAKPSKANARGPKPRQPKGPPVLEQVAEEEDTENDSVSFRVPVPPTSTDALNESGFGGAGVRKKKQKLLGGVLGKTLFDDDEGDVVKGYRGLSAGVKGSISLARGGSRKSLGRNLGSFGDISPLKKDRKGAV